MSDSDIQKCADKFTPLVKISFLTKHLTILYHQEGVEKNKKKFLKKVTTDYSG